MNQSGKLIEKLLFIDVKTFFDKNFFNQKYSKKFPENFDQYNLSPPIDTAEL